MKEYDIFIPLYYNDGTPIESAKFQNLQALLNVEIQPLRSECNQTNAREIQNQNLAHARSVCAARPLGRIQLGISAWRSIPTVGTAGCEVYRD